MIVTSFLEAINPASTQQGQGTYALHIMMPSVLFHICPILLSHCTVFIEFVPHTHTMQIALNIHFVLSHKFPKEELHFITVTELKKFSENQETLKVYKRRE